MRSEDRAELDPEIKEWVDKASYEQLLTRWRTGDVGDPAFVGKTADYYLEVMVKKRKEAGEAEHSRISKSLGGW